MGWIQEMASTPKEGAGLQVEIKRVFNEMEQADQRIKRHQEETARLKAETRTLLDTLKSRMGQE